MKNISLALFTLALVFSPSYSQQKDTRQASRASIEVAGVKLQLGMTKATVVQTPFSTHPRVLLGTRMKEQLRLPCENCS